MKGSTTGSRMTDHPKRVSAMLMRIGVSMMLLLVGSGLSGAAASEAGTLAADGRIAFSTNRDGNYEVYVMNADGSGQTRLTNEAASDFAGPGSPVWSPDGSKIAFKTARHGNWEVNVMNADGSGQTRLTNHPDIDIYPAWSPDGKRIAFQSWRDGGAPEVYVMNADGSGQTRLTNNSVFDGSPAWSPDGTKIAFASARGWNLNVEVYVMNADGSAQTNLTNHTAADRPPAWSPDGSKIAFASDRDGGKFEIYVMNADGSAQTRLTNNPASDNPSWGSVAKATDEPQSHPDEPDQTGSEKTSISVSVTGGKAKEGKLVRYKVRLSAPFDRFEYLEYKTKKGTARPGKDFKSKSGTLQFDPGQTSASLGIRTIEDAMREPSENFSVLVSYSGVTTRALGKIKDDD